MVDVTEFVEISNRTSLTCWQVISRNQAVYGGVRLVEQARFIRDQRQRAHIYGEKTLEVYGI